MKHVWKWIAAVVGGLVGLIILPSLQVHLSKKDML